MQYLIFRMNDFYINFNQIVFQYAKILIVRNILLKCHIISLNQNMFFPERKSKTFAKELKTYILLEEMQII